MLRFSRRTKSRRPNKFARRKFFCEPLENRDLLSTFSVLNTNDTGAGSLRQAILDSNSNLGSDVIQFNIAATDANHLYYKNDGVAGQVNPYSNIVHTTATNDSTIADIDPDWAHSWYRITPTSALPAITGPVTIDGYTQPGASVNTLTNGDNAVLRIQFDGSYSSQFVNTGLIVTGGNSTIRGFNVVYGTQGITLQTAGGNVVEGNFIGTDISGTVARSNHNGVHILGSSDNVIGGTAAASRNVISGNEGSGVFIDKSTTVAARNIIVGNFIGTSAAGNKPAGPDDVRNRVAGVSIFDAQDNVVGGTAPGARNVISGNVSGIVIRNHQGFPAVQGRNIIEGNFIGTDASGTVAFGNGEGIFIHQSHNNRIGGIAPGAGNVISANGTYGIVIAGFQDDVMSAIGNVVQGNRIGLDATGNGLLGNRFSGVQVDWARNTLIGGTTPGAGNFISDNDHHGILIGNSIDTVVQGNVIGETVNGSPAGHFGDGIFVTTSWNTLIGGDVPGAGNTIANNGRDYGPSPQPSSRGPAGVRVHDDVNPTAWWRAENNALNAINNSPHGTLQGGAGFAPGKFGYAFQFDGINDYVDLGDTLEYSEEWSLEAWIRPNRVDKSQQVISKFGSGGNAYQIGLTSTGALQAQVSENGVLHTLQSAPGTVAAGQWTHVGMTFDNIPRVWTLYLNGVEVASKTNVTVIDTNGTTPLSIGRKSDGTEYFDGLIDEPAIYRVITDDPFPSAMIPLRYQTGGVNKWQGTSIRGNNIYDNGDLGIELTVPLGPNPTDAGDTDVGANDKQNVPMITSATSDGAQVTVQGTLDSIPFATYTLEFFANSEAPPPLAEIEGEQLIGLGTVVADGTGTANFEFTLDVAVPVDYLISATATVMSDHDSNPNTPLISIATSEFSGPEAVVPGDDNSGNCVINTNDSGPGSLRQAILDANANAGADVICFKIPASDANHVYYKNDGVAGSVTPGNITVTSATNDSTIGDIDPDHAHSWWAITPTSVLPRITGPTTIDGYTQPGASVNTSSGGLNAVLRIELNGSLANTPSTGGLLFDAHDSTLRGLSVHSFWRQVVVGGLVFVQRHVVEGSFIGVDPSGTRAGTNQGHSVSINAGGNGLVGTDADGVNDLAERNLISGGTYGVALSGGSGYVVAGNLIGTDITGTRAIPNTVNGINVQHDDFLIGGTAEVARNVVSGNTGFGGISINDIGNGPAGKVQGNFVGVDVTGTRALGNSGYGISRGVTGSTTTQTVLIGGTEVGARNIVSANGTGIILSNAGTASAAAVVQGNYIGTDVTGMVDLGNVANGIFMRGPGPQIGGTAPGAGNLISGNGQNGVVIGDTLVPTANSRIEGNRIGTNADGTGFLGNSLSGIFIAGSATSNLIGGTGIGAGNVIAGNTLAGVRVAGGSGNPIRGNSIYSNGSLGIDLGPGNGFSPHGVTANDAGDVDIGPNDFQNYPLVASVNSSASSTIVTGTLNSTPNTSFTLDFYSSAAADPSGFGEGQTYLGSSTVTTDASGNATFTATLPVATPAGHVVTATATAPNSSTSEFSGKTTVAPFVPATISGVKFNDLNSDGDRDVGEAGLANWTITVDANADGTVDGSTTTDANGMYTFTGLQPNVYRVREVQQPGWTQTSVDPADIIVNSSGQSFADVNFGNRQDACTPPGDILGDPEPFDLSTFTKIQYEVNLHPNASWVLSNGNTVATQTVNADPSIFLAPDNLASNIIEGRWRVNQGGDDDFMGFVFGFQDTEHFYLFDWKAATQGLSWGTAERGMSVKVVNASSPLTGPDLWPTAGNGTRVQTLFHNTIPWQVGVDYNFRLEIRPGEFTINVTGPSGVIASITIQDNTYSSGRFGFYNFSQHAVIYSGFTQSTITPVQTATISGTKFNDLDGDGARDNSEPGLAGWTIQLDAGANGSVDYTTTTDAAGYYRFEGLPLGTYRARELQQPGWSQTTADPADIFIISCDQVAEGVNFGNVQDDIGGRISGVKFNDEDADGVRDSGEAGIGYWAIFIDTNGSGVHELGEPYTHTNLSGGYSFTNLDPGTYRVREVQEAGWVQTTQNPADIVITASGQTFAGVDFGNDRDPTVTMITGAKFNDADGDGVRDAGEPGLAYWPIFLDTNGNGTRELGERLTFTNLFGNYAFAGVAPGTYQVREIQQAGWTQTTANPAHAVVTQVGQTVSGGDFGNQRDPVTLITGRKFYDVDADGVNDPGEPGLRYWPIYLDTNGDNAYQTGEPVTSTDWNGFYHFTGVEPGTYRVREIQQLGWTQTTTDPADVVVTTDGEFFEGVDFGNRRADGSGVPGDPGDLDITKDAPRAVAGEKITYTLRVTNRGPADSYGVILGDQLPSGLVFESATPSQGTCRGGQTIICAVGPLEVGETATVTIVAHVLSWVQVEIENEACVYSTGTDTDPADNCAISRTPIDTDTDLRLVKTADGLRAIAGRDLTYTLRVTNNGPSDSTNVTLEDELPPEVSFVSAESTHGTCALEMTTVATVVCDLGTVANGETAIVTLVVHVGPWVPEDAIITNKARVRDPHGGSGDAVIRIPCGRSVDMEVNKTGPFTTVDAQVYYVIEVTNHGPSNSAGPIVGDDLPDDINFLYAVASQGHCNQQDPLVCNLGPMVVGQTETVTVFVGVPQTVVIENVRNEAVVQPPEGDPGLRNNHGGTGGIRPVYGLGIVKEAPPEIPAGEYLTYTLEVINEGPDNASNVIVGDTIPPGLILVSATPSQGSCYTVYNPILCFLGAMQVGEVETVEIVVFVPPDIPEDTVFVNTGYGWGGIEPVFGSATTRVIRRADVSLEKEAPEEVPAGTEMTYTLRTRNRGPSDSTNITLEDVLPPEVEFRSATPSQGTCTDSEANGQTTVSCALGDIPSGGMAEVEIVVFVPAFTAEGIIIENGACVTAFVLDPDLTNNCDVVHTGVEEVPDLRVKKTSTPGPITAGENIEYTLEVENLGPSDASHVVLGDTLPAGVVFVSATTTQGSCEYTGGIVRCDIGYVAVGQDEFVTIVAFVPPTTPHGTVIENTGCIIECGHDPFHDNDCGTVRNTIRAESVITGIKFNDLDGDGVRDADEPGIEGWQIFLDLDGDNVLDPNERSVTTDASGRYTFVGVGKATWFVREVQNPDWIQTTPNPDGVTVTGLLQTYDGGDFGNFKKIVISGRVYHDHDRDGILDPGEPGLGGWIVIDDTNNNGVLDPGERSTITDPDGDYSIGDLGPGTHIMREFLTADWIVTTPNPAPPIVARSGDDRTGIDFGNARAGVPGKITGGGSIDERVRNFGFVVMPKTQAGVTTFFGNLEYQDKVLGYNLASTTITSINIEPDRIHGQFSGTATLNGVAGYNFFVEIEDRAEPGALIDKFRIQISGPGGFTYDSNTACNCSGTLTKGGNIQIHKPGSSLLSSGGTDGSGAGSPLISSAGQLLQGVLAIAVDDSEGALESGQRARLSDAVATLNESFASFGVTLTENVGWDENADIVLKVAADSPCGAAADGVLGCTSDTNTITLLVGWNWYTGDDGNQVGAEQFDYQTIVTHELGHAIGLGHSGDSTSVMYSALAPGVSRRHLSASDLALSEPDHEADEAEALFAHGFGDADHDSHDHPVSGRDAEDVEAIDAIFFMQNHGDPANSSDSTDDVLVGGDGDDMQIGASGRDQLVGGIATVTSAASSSRHEHSKRLHYTELTDIALDDILEELAR